MAGERFGRFELLERLGHGERTEVFLARDTSSNARVVLKRLLPHLRGDRALGERFLSEVGIGARLVHPNLSRVLELGELGGVFFFTQEFIEGRDVSKLGPVSIPVAARVVADAAAGLEAAHDARERDGRRLGVAHGDVAPRNLVLGTDGRTRVIDFGLATLRERDEGSLGGTYEYMSPEQALDGVTNAASDQFSLGVVFWELLTGRRLFAGDTDTLTLDQVLECRVASPRESNPRVPPVLEAVVMRMLAKDPRERFASCGEIATRLEGFLREQPPAPPPARRQPVVEPVHQSAATAQVTSVSAGDRAVLGQLELLEPPLTIEAIEAALVLPIGSPPALDVAQALADRGLLTFEGSGLALTPDLAPFHRAIHSLLAATEAGRPEALASVLRALLQVTGLSPAPATDLAPPRTVETLTLTEWCSWATETVATRPFTCELSWFVQRLHALQAPWAIEAARAVLVDGSAGR